MWTCWPQVFHVRASRRQELGTDSKIPRGELFFEIPRILAEFEAEHSPRLVILENVPYLLYGAEGTWFDEVVERCDEPDIGLGPSHAGR